MVRTAVTAFLRFCLRIFYRRIEVLGLERIPVDGGVVFAVNHPNGLIDPLFVLCFAPRAVSFLAKAPLFRYPVIGWFVRALDSIPVYRKQDNVSGSNSEMFSRAHDILQRGGSIAIFPEGTTHDDPRMRELKTGAARIALGAAAQVVVVPAAIYYTDKHIFRSSALVVFGESLPVTPVGAEGEPPRSEVESLTGRIDVELDEMTLQADSHSALALIGRAEDIFTASQDQSLEQELALRRRFVDGYHYLRAHDPKRLEKLQSSMVQFESELRRAKLDVHDLTPSLEPARLARVIVLLPIALVGTIISYPAWIVVDALARRHSKGERNLLATTKFLAALALYPLTYLALAVLIGWIFGPVAGLAAAIAFPFMAWVALRTIEDIDSVIGDVRAIAHRMSRRYGHGRLIAQRDAIREELLEVAREVDSR